MKRQNASRKRQLVSAFALTALVVTVSQPIYAQTAESEEDLLLGAPETQADTESVQVAQAQAVDLLEIRLNSDGLWQAMPVAGNFSAYTLNSPVQRTWDTFSAWLHEDQSLLFGRTGYAAIEMQGWVRAGSAFSVTLPCNPSTGFIWEAEQLDPALATALVPDGIRPYTATLGSSATCTYQVTAANDGVAALSLVHRRPWLPHQPVARRLRLIGEPADKVGLEQIASAVSWPMPPPLPDDAFAMPVKEGEAQEAPPLLASDALSAQNLPTYFNWCAHGKCTPIRDQGPCGSCWAFATVGVMESVVLIARPDIDRNRLNFSEQFLVSCNRRGWGCRTGGWWGHDYHTNLRILGEPMAGPVGERFFPYQAADVACNSPYPHFWQGKAWGFVSGQPIPDVNTLKQALLDHGPLSVAVWVGPNFQQYRGGVFRTNEATGSCPINHAVVLVGWDDSQQAWIIRNSWGTQWGEGGYMRIGYGVSNIGYRAAYANGVRLFNRRLFMPFVRQRPQAGPAVFPIPDGDFEGQVEAWWNWRTGYAYNTRIPERSSQHVARRHLKFGRFDPPAAARSTPGDASALLALYLGRRKLWQRSRGFAPEQSGCAHMAAVQ
ncbi:MAG: C1 family peptidase [Thermoflexales bacterium]